MIGDHGLQYNYDTANYYSDMIVSKEEENKSAYEKFLNYFSYSCGICGRLEAV